MKNINIDAIKDSLSEVEIKNIRRKSKLLVLIYLILMVLH
jgi:hypothetical protein